LEYIKINKFEISNYKDAKERSILNQLENAINLANEGMRPSIFAKGVNDFRNKAFNWLISRGEKWVTLTHAKGELKLSPSDFRHYFKNDWAKYASSLYLRQSLDKSELLKQVESDLRYMQDFIIDTLEFIFDLAESAINKRIILYPHNAYGYGYSASLLNNKYLPPKDSNLNE